MISRLNWLAGSLLFMAGFGTLMNPPPYIIIAILFFFMGLVLLPPTNRLTKQQFNWEINHRTKTIILTIGFILIYLFVPQIEPKHSPFSHRPIEFREKFN